MNICSLVPKKNSGFSLVELLVAVSIFIVVILIAVGSLMTMLDANLKTRNQRIVYTDLNFSVDSIVRMIRSGSNYQIQNGNTQLTFLNKDGDTVVLSLTTTGTIGTLTITVNGNATPLTSPSLDIERLTFQEVPYSGDPSSEYEKILLVIHGQTATGDPATDSDFTLQTTVSRDAVVTIPSLNAQPQPLNGKAFCPIPVSTPNLTLIHLESYNEVASLFVDKFTYRTVGSTFFNNNCGDRSSGRNCAISNGGRGEKNLAEGSTYGMRYDAVQYGRAINTRSDIFFAPRTFSVPPGEYDIIIGAWDNHDGSGSIFDCSTIATSSRRGTEINEGIVAELIGLAGNIVYTTTPTTDLPDPNNCYSDVSITTVATNYVLTDTIEQINMRHGTCPTEGSCTDFGGGSGSSVHAACIGFVCTGGACASGGAQITLPEQEI